MNDPQLPSSPVSEEATVLAGECPAAADLIDFALGHVSREDWQRIDGHLHSGACPHCRSWIETATRFRGEPQPNPGVALALPLPPAPPPTSDPTPIPESSKWQRKAFRDLERRLRQLEQ